jgi:hypothetical protein
MRIWALRETHAAAHLIDRRIPMFLSPLFESAANMREMCRTFAEQRRDDLDGVGAGHHGFHRIDRLVYAAGCRE